MINNNRDNIVISGLPSGLSVISFRFYSIDKHLINSNNNGNIPSEAQYVSILCAGNNLNADTKNNIKSSSVQLEYGNQSTVYEVFHAPITTNLFLPSQLRDVGSGTEYIDYRSQKLFFADGTYVKVTLPPLSTISGINTISAETTTLPSKVEMTGRITL